MSSSMYFIISGLIFSSLFHFELIFVRRVFPLYVFVFFVKNYLLTYMQVYFWAVNSVPLVFVSALRGSAIIISKLQMGMLQCRGLMEPALGPTRGINEQAGGLSSHSLPPLPCSLMWFPRSGPWRSSPSTVSQGLAGHELLLAMRVTSLFFHYFMSAIFNLFHLMPHVT